MIIFFVSIFFYMWICLYVCLFHFTWVQNFLRVRLFECPCISAPMILFPRQRFFFHCIFLYGHGSFPCVCFLWVNDYFMCPYFFYVYICVCMCIHIILTAYIFLVRVCPFPLFLVCRYSFCVSLFSCLYTSFSVTLFLVRLCLSICLVVLGIGISRRYMCMNMPSWLGDTFSANQRMYMCKYACMTAHALDLSKCLLEINMCFSAQFLISPWRISSKLTSLYFGSKYDACIHRKIYTSLHDHIYRMSTLAMILCKTENKRRLLTLLC